MRSDLRLNVSPKPMRLLARQVAPYKPVAKNIHIAWTRKNPVSTQWQHLLLTARHNCNIHNTFPLNRSNILPTKCIRKQYHSENRAVGWFPPLAGTDRRLATCFKRPYHAQSKRNAILRQDTVVWVPLLRRTYNTRSSTSFWKSGLDWKALLFFWRWFIYYISVQRINVETLPTPTRIVLSSHFNTLLCSTILKRKIINCEAYGTTWQLYTLRCYGSVPEWKGAPRKPQVKIAKVSVKVRTRYCTTWEVWPWFGPLQWSDTASGGYIKIKKPMNMGGGKILTNIKKVIVYRRRGESWLASCLQFILLIGSSAFRRYRTENQLQSQICNIYI